MDYSNVLERFYDLRRDRLEGHERPHKPLLLITLIDLLEAGVASGNRFLIDDRLFQVWRSYFDIVKGRNDRPTVENPLYYLSGDGVWGLVARDGGGDLYGYWGTRITPTKSWLKQNAQYGRFSPEVYEVLQRPELLSPLREAIIGRYFPDQSDALLEVSRTTVARLSGGRAVEREARDDATSQDARDRAFRKIVLDQYDNRCTACGLRLIVDDVVVVDAAHLVPWSESRNDHPSNGIALCKNHHWAMDRRLLAPGTDRRWHVSSRLDGRIMDHRPLLELDLQDMFEPSESKYMPKEPYLRWRQDRLL